MKITGIPLQTARKLTLEERVTQLENQIYEQCIFHSDPLWKRQRDTTMQLYKLAEHFRLRWMRDNRPVEEGWRKETKWWWL